MWSEAVLPPFNNIIGENPQLTDPENGNYQPLNSSAISYGCQTFLADNLSIKNKIGTSAIANYSRISETSINDNYVYVGGIITENTIWDIDTIKVVSDIIIPDNISLQILSGTKIEFQGFYSIEINGQIIAIGEPDNLIEFTSISPELFTLDENENGAWNGLRFRNILSTNNLSKLEFCKFSCSKAIEDNGFGGVISINNFSKLLINCCIFEMNLAKRGGVIFCNTNANPIISNNLMAFNYGLLSCSTIFSSYSFPKIINNTIVNNECLNEDIFLSTATIHNYISKPFVQNNIIRDNVCAFFMESEFLYAKPFYTTYNNISNGFEGTGNFDLDPNFIFYGNHPYSINSPSQCIDNGSYEISEFMTSEVDLSGNERINNIIDIGAYEFYSNSQIPYGDIDNNGLVEAYDASLALIYSIGGNPLPLIDPLPWQEWRFVIADVDGNNEIQAFDAALILQYSVGLITTFPIED